MPRERLGASTAVILFADIVDSTALTERMGDAAFRSLARKLDGTLRDLIRRCSGETIEGKLLGDGVLAVFGSAHRAIDCALQCAAEGATAGLPLHLGVHAGDVIRESNNVFGGAVNIAARIAGASGPGEVLVSDTVRGLARTSSDVSFDDRGPQEFKGVSEPLRVYRAQSRRSGISLAARAGRRAGGGPSARWLVAFAVAAIAVIGAAAAVFLLADGGGEGGGADQLELATSVLTVGDQSVQLDVAHNAEEASSIEYDEREPNDGAGVMYDSVQPPATTDTGAYEFAVDLIWLDAAKQVLAVHAGLTNASAIVPTPDGARYAVELNGGAAARIGITDGAKLNMYTATLVSTPEGTLNAEVACTDEDMKQVALVGRPSLDQNSALLYNWRDTGVGNWNTEGYLFTIDFVWLDESKAVISVTPNVAPGSQGIPPPAQMYYAIETNAGATERFGLTPGAVLSFDVPCDPA